jgi:hypothetical protein
LDKKKMTRDKILNKPAGREMDALVAEIVMGWEYIPDKQERKTWSSTHWVNWKDSKGKTQLLVLSYSTDIAAAWQVVEKTMLLDNYDLMKDGENYIFGHYGKNGIDPWTEFVRASTAPLAICRAALLAVLEE